MCVILVSTLSMGSYFKLKCSFYIIHFDLDRRRYLILLKISLASVRVFLKLF